MIIKPVESEREWEMARGIRTRVFVEEQGCPPEEEWDAYDERSRHIIVLVNGSPAATARWRVAPYAERLAAKLERFAVLPEYRGKGLGRQLVAYVIRDAEAAGFPVQVIHAQAHLRSFYESFDFVAEGDLFMEAGIPHIKMARMPGR